jgi:hypothetical protein
MDVELYSGSQYNKSQSGCLDEALSALQGLGRDDLKDFISKVSAEAEEKGISMEAAVKNQEGQLSIDLQNKLYRINKQYDLLFNPENGEFNQIAKGKIRLRDLLTKNTLKRRGTNLETTQQSISVKLRQKFFGQQSVGAQEAFMTGEGDKAIAEYLDSGNVPKGQEHIVENGKAIKDLVLNAKTELVDSTAMGTGDLNKYRQLQGSYDPIKLKKMPAIKDVLGLFRNGFKIPRVSGAEARQSFIDKMHGRSNLKAMFGKEWNDKSVTGEAFGEMYDNILQSEKTIKSAVSSVSDKPELAKKSRLFVVWKDWGSYVDHIQEYGNGQGTLYEQVMSEINSVGRKAGMARVLGADPNWGFNELLKADLHKNQKVPFFRNPVHIFNNLNGSANIPFRPYVAQMQANVMAYLGAVKQIPLSIISLNDTNFGLSALSEITKTNEFQNFATKIKAIGSIYKSQLTKGALDPGLKRMMDNSYHSLQFEMGAHMRFIEAQNMGGITRKLTHKLYTANGMAGKDAANRSSAMYLASKALVDNKGVKFDNLIDPVKKRLTSFNMNSDEWDTVRKSIAKDPSTNLELLGADTINEIPDEDIKTLATKLGKSTGDTRSDLHTKVYGWLNSVADETILTPGAEEHAQLFFGTSPGSAAGMAFRAFGQFKGFLASYVNRTLINGVQDPAASKIRWGLSNFLYTLPLTMAGNAFYNVSHGTPLNLDPTKWNFDDWTEALLPGIAMFNKVLDPQNQNPSLALSLLQSPTTNALGDMLSLGATSVNALRPSTGRAETRLRRVRGKAAKVAYDATPINSIPYLSDWWKKNAISTRQ